MKKILALLLLTCSLHASTGNKTLTNTTIDSLEHMGVLALKNVDIPGELSGSGSFAASECTFGSIKWTGAAHLRNCRILRNSTFTGSLLAAQTTFERNVTVTSNYVELDGGVIKGDLIIQPTSRSDEEQTVALSGAALVKGDIRFLSGNGVLKKTGRAEVQGQVIGLKE
jgi:hypothetical protein